MKTRKTLIMAAWTKTTFLCVIISVSLFDVESISMTPEDYRNLIVKRCFNQTAFREDLFLGQYRPVGMTIDYLASLIHKVEDKLPQLKSKEILLILLKRFHYDGIKYVGFENIQSITETFRRDINDNIFRNQLNQNKQLEFPEEILTEDEKCAMFFMMSHTINQTKIDNERSIRKELGVTSLMNSDNVAIATNRVLLGIAVGLWNMQTTNVPLVMPDENSAKEVVINTLLAVTLSDELAIASMKSIINERNYALFGSVGKWNSSYCQTEYKLDYDGGYHVSMAEINGGIDGYLIGKKLMSDSSQFLNEIKLSEIIKHYYSTNGLGPDCGVCSVGYFPNDLIDTIRQESLRYVYLWNTNYNHDRYEKEKLAGYVDTNSAQFNQFIIKSNDIKMSECSRIRNVLYGNTMCETSSDIFIMIDNNVMQLSNFQLEFVTSLLIKLKSLDYLNTVTILLNANRGFDSDRVSLNPADMQIPLHLLTYNTTSIQQATCRLAWYNYRETTINDKRIILNHLIRFFERNNVTNIYDSSSKNFLWFSLKSNSYNRLSEREKVTYYKYKWYLKYYLNVRTFFASASEKNEDDDLYNIMLNQDDWFKVNPYNMYDDTVINRLVNKMCETPSAVDYDDCLNSTSSGVELENVISQNRKQYWAIYPKYYLYEESITLKFRAKDAKIHVCLDRWLYPESNIRRCKEAGKDNEEINFVIDQPCRWKTIENCQPIYFTVSVANKNLLSQYDCLEPKCKTFDQIRWTITHTGLSCGQITNSALNLKLSLTILLELLMIALVIFAVR